MAFSSLSATAAPYYWVGGTGNWSDLTHWASTSGGPGSAYTQVPQSTDDVLFDAASFTAANQTVTLSATVACLNMDWRGVTRTGIQLLGSGTVEVYDNLHLAASMGQQAASFRFLAATTGHAVDLQNVPIAGGLFFDKAGGSWTFTSDVNLLPYNSAASLQVLNGTLNFGSVTASVYGLSSSVSTTRAINLGSSTINLWMDNNTWTLTATGLTFNAGTSTLNLVAPPTSSTPATSGLLFTSSQVAYHNVTVAAGAAARLSVAGSSFDNLTVNGTAILNSAATIQQALTVGAEANLQFASSQTVTFAGAATLVSTGTCAGLASVQATQVGTPATLLRPAGWGGVSFGYTVLRALTFSNGSAGTGSATATNSVDRGGNTNLTVSALPSSTLYWVGGSGTWHDPTHWASTSGGSGGSCLPTLATNVVFDANSFSARNQVVTLDGTGAACAAMDWSALTQPTALRTPAGDYTRQPLCVGGSLTLSPLLDVSNLLTSDIFLTGSAAGSTTYILTTAGRSLLTNVCVQAPGSTYQLQDALTLTSANPTVAISANGRLYVEAGTLATNSLPLAAQGLTLGYVSQPVLLTSGQGTLAVASSAAATLSLGSSTVRIVPSAKPNNQYSWDVADGATLVAGTSVVNIGGNPSTSQGGQFFRGGGQSYNLVNFTDVFATSNLPTLSNSGATFQELTFAGSAILNVSNTYTGRLKLAAGSTYTVLGGASGAQKFTGSGRLEAAGGCAGQNSVLITIQSASTTPAQFSRPASGTNPALQGVLLRNTAWSGAGWTAASSFDLGGNSGIALTAPVARVLYWVGGTGNWSDPAHWASTSGGTDTNCPPTPTDDVFFDANSFSRTGQAVTQDIGVAYVRNLSWAAATNAPTFSGVADNSLQVFGSLSWAATMTQNLLGTTIFCGTGTLTSAGQLFPGYLVLNAPGATLTLADALRQTTTGSSTNGLDLQAGTLTTNGYDVRLRNFTSTTTTARALNLGATSLEITGYAWTVTNPTSFTLNAGTSSIYLNVLGPGGGSGAFNGGGVSYATVRTSAGGNHGVNGNNTFAALQLYGLNRITGSNTITSQLYLNPGDTFQFSAGTTTTFAAAANVQAVGTGSRVITLQSNSSGSQFTWTKPSGSVCASYVYIRDSRATGGAYYEGGEQANNQGNNTGWSFAFVPQAAYTGNKVCPGAGAHYLRLTFTAYDPNTQSSTTLTAAQYPLQVVVNNLTDGTSQTVSVSAATYDLLIPTSTATAQYQVGSITTNASSCGPLTNRGPFPVVTDEILSGPAGQWVGTQAGGDWANCQNWASGTLPTTATDVSIGSAAPYQAVLSGSGAARSLTIASGASLQVSAAGRLTLAGDWLNNGTASFDPASAVTFAGSQAQAVTNGYFANVTLNNPAGLTLQTTASTGGQLTLTAGLIRTGSYQWQHLNTAAASLSGYSASSYVAGNLRRAVAAGSTATYGFPVGTASQYALLELLTSSLTGTTTLDAQFGPKPGTDVGLNYAEPGSSQRYTKINDAGVWTLTPNAQPTGGSYAVRLALAPFSGLVDNAYLVLKRPDTSASAADWTGDGGSVNADNGAGRRVADGYALRWGLRRFSQFGLAQVAAAPLPVTLVNFLATAQQASVLLSWNTASELNSARFEVERSIDGQAFTRIAQVAAAGSSASARAYAYRDAGLPAGTPLLYYRLRQVDQDGTATYSPVRPVTVSVTGLVVYPNPARAAATLAGAPAHTVVQVLDALGQVLAVATTDAAGNAQLALPTGLAAGLYIVRCAGQTQRLVVE